MQVSRKRIIYSIFCIQLAVIFCWFVARLSSTFLPEPKSSPPVERVVTVQRGSGAAKSLEERVRTVVAKVRSSVVAVTHPGVDSPRPGYNSRYASGVIVTPDGIVLSNWHVSHTPHVHPGEMTKVILHDGSERVAELLGASQTHDVSLLRLIGPGPCPYTPILASPELRVGDWVIKLGHPLGFRPDRPAPVRIGRVLSRTDEVWLTDCPCTGGDSGGPFFDLDGQLAGVPRFTSQVPHTDDELLFRRSSFLCVNGIGLIRSLFDAMQAGELEERDDVARTRIADELAAAEQLQPADWSQGRDTLVRYRSAVSTVRSSVVTVLNTGVPVGLGTVVRPDGWVLTKASELPAQPTCRMPNRRVITAHVAGVDLAFDLALLKVDMRGLEPVKWADCFDPPTGTLLAAVSPEELPLAVGVVSVPRRNLSDVAFPKYTLPLSIPAGQPSIYGTSRAKSGYSLRAAFGLSRHELYTVWHASGLAWSAGIRPGDVLQNVDGQQILVDKDLAKVVSQRHAGDVVPVRLSRSGEVIDLNLPLSAETRRIERSYRDDNFPTVIECAVSFLSYECGGPIVDLTGCTVGISIARVSPHGGMLIPGDCVQALLPQLQDGKSGGNWESGRTVDK